MKPDPIKASDEVGLNVVGQMLGWHHILLCANTFRILGAKSFNFPHTTPVFVS